MFFCFLYCACFIFSGSNASFCVFVLWVFLGEAEQSCPILPVCYGPLRAVDGSCAPQYKPSALLSVRILHTYGACISLLYQGTVYSRFAICTICTIRMDRQTVYTLSCHEIFYVPLIRCNFLDRKRLFTDRSRVLQFLRSVRIVTWLTRTVIVRVYWTTLHSV